MYYADMETRLREHTMRTKKYIVELKILPYFGNKRVNDITAADIRQWQNELIKKGYSPTYLKTINNQLSAIFNYAVRYYDLKSNPCVKAGSMGKSKAEEMNFWTGEEFRKFIDSAMNKRLSYMAFMILYWMGMRLGELLALNPKDDLYKWIHFSGRTIQEYMLQSAPCQQVMVVGNSRLQHEIQERLKEIEPKLDLIARGEHVEEAVMEELRTTYEIAQTWE